MRVALVTVSDSVTQGNRPDRSGPELRERCLARGWQVVSAVVTPDEPSGNETTSAAPGGARRNPRSKAPSVRAL